MQLFESRKNLLGGLFVKVAWQKVAPSLQALGSYFSCPLNRNLGFDVMITIFCEKIDVFFSKTNVMIKFLHNLALF
jgi:hypothetical protein